MLVNDMRKKEEIINGTIYAMSPSPDYRHGTVNLNIHALLTGQLHDSLCMVFAENLDFKYDKESDDYLIPDVMLLCDRKNLKGGSYSGVPKFIVETLSPSTAFRDRTIKKDIYEKSGVEEYWIIDVNAKSIEVYILDNEKYRLADLKIFVTDKDSDDYNENDVMTLRSMPHIQMPLKSIFAKTYFD
jgi:Uma2 family endonuclease